MLHVMFLYKTIYWKMCVPNSSDILSTRYYNFMVTPFSV